MRHSGARVCALKILFLALWPLRKEGRYVRNIFAVLRPLPEGRGMLDLIAMHAVVAERNKWLTVTPLRNFMDSVG